MAEFILKDWYGKEKSFDHETIYVRDAEGNLMPFTHGTGNPVLQDKTITENGEYTADEGFDGLGSVTVNVAGGAAGFERVTRIPEQTVTPTYDSNYGCYKINLTLTGKITENSVLAIYFNGKRYDCTLRKYAFTAGAWNNAMNVCGNHKIMTKYFNSAMSWKETQEQKEPFLFTENAWLCTSSADSFTFRVDEIIITDL